MSAAKVVEGKGEVVGRLLRDWSLPFLRRILTKNYYYYFYFYCYYFYFIYWAGRGAVPSTPKKVTLFHGLNYT